MSLNSLDQFSERLQNLPLQNPPKGLLLDVQNTVRRRKTLKQKVTQCSVVFSLFVATLWIVVDQQSSFHLEGDLAIGGEHAEVEVPDTQNLNPGISISSTVMRQPPSSLTPTAIVFRISDIDQEIEKLPMSDTARRKELLRTRETLKENYRSIRLQQQATAYQKVGYYN